MLGIIVADNAIIGTFGKQCLRVLSPAYSFQNIPQSHIKYALSIALHTKRLLNTLDIFRILQRKKTEACAKVPLVSQE